MKSIASIFDVCRTIGGGVDFAGMNADGLMTFLALGSSFSG